MSRPIFPHTIDSTILSAFRSCAWKCYLQYFQHWKPKGESVHLIAGGAFAAGVEAARIAFFIEGLSAEDSLAAGLRALLTHYGDFECPEGSAKSPERVAGALEFYLSQYPLGRDGAKPIIFSDKLHGIELSFAKPLDFLHPISKEPVLYTGRSDMVGEFAGGTYVFDEKTTSQLGASWARQWELRCFDDQHELYTRDGWRFIKAIDETVEVLQATQEGELTFTFPKEVICKEVVDEPMIKIEGRRLSQQITLNHRVLLSKRRGGFTTVLAESLHKQDQRHSIPLAGIYEGEKLPDDIQRFLVAVQADAKLSVSKGKIGSGQGHRKHMPCRSIEFGFSKERKILRLTQLLQRLEIPYKDRNDVRNTFYISGFEEIAELVDMVLDEHKNFKAGYEVLFGDAFLDELEFWDGWGKQYYTNSSFNAHFVATVAALNDRTASVSCDNYGHWTVVLSSDTQRSLSKSVIEKVKYTGKVYCVSVPTGYVLTRRNGVISISGNSQFTGYCWGSQDFGINVAGVIVRGVSILKTKYDTLQVITYRSDWEIERWKQQVEADLRRMQRCWEEDYWDYSLDHACDEYGGCAFAHICKSNDPKTWLPMYFEKRVWDPLLRKQISVEEYEAQWGGE